MAEVITATEYIAFSWSDPTGEFWDGHSPSREQRDAMRWEDDGGSCP